VSAWDELVAEIARARGPALDADRQLEWDARHGVGNAERFWRFVRFDAENEPDRLDHRMELDRLEAERRSGARRERAATLPPPSPGTLTLEQALSRLERVRKSGRGWTARCPVHEDTSPSLFISESEMRPGEPVFHCFVGCDFRLIRDALR
jgi:hypothetical protein